MRALTEVDISRTDAQLIRDLAVNGGSSPAAEDETAAAPSPGGRRRSLQNGPASTLHSGFARRNKALRRWVNIFNRCS